MGERLEKMGLIKDEDEKLIVVQRRAAVADPALQRLTSISSVELHQTVLRKHKGLDSGISFFFPMIRLVPLASFVMNTYNCL